MDRTCLIGLDLGTTMLKGVLIETDGTLVSREKAPMEYVKKEDGSVEFDGELFWQKVAGMLRSLSQSLPQGARIAGISMASASGNTVVLDEKGVPLLPVFSWLDKRCKEELNQVFGEMGDPERRLVGWGFGNEFPAAHLSWLRVHHPQVLEKAAHICMSTDYLNYRLTDKWGIDTSTATTFYLQDQKTAQWHKPFLEKLGIPEGKLPPIYPCGTLLGTVTEKAAAETGLQPGTPVVLGSFDHPCGARGSGVVEEGQMLLSCGTSWVGFYPIKDREKALDLGMIVDPFLSPDGPWGSMFSLPNISGSIDAYIRRYIADGDDRYEQFDVLAEAAPPGANGLQIDLKNLCSSKPLEECSKEDIARALMEGTAHLLRERMQQMHAHGVEAKQITMVGGPSETEPWPQIVCDILGMPITVLCSSCIGAVGAALLAGVSAGIYKDIKEAFSGMVLQKKMLIPCQETMEK